MQSESFLEGLRDGRSAPPRNCESLQFEAPWQGRAFGMVLALAEANAYKYEDFRKSLIATIGSWDRTHERDDPAWNYYEQWLHAFEALVLEKGLIDTRELDERTEAFQTRARDEVI